MQGSLPTKPRLHRSYHIISDPESDEIQLHSEGRAVRLQPVTPPDLLKRLVPLLDGTHTVDEVKNMMRGFDEARVADSLQLLYEARLLEDAAHSTTSLSKAQEDLYASQLAFFSHFTDEPYKFQATLLRSEVAVIGLGDLGRTLVSSLADNGTGRLAGIEIAEGPSADADLVHGQLQQQCATKSPWTTYEAITLRSDTPSQIEAAVGGAELLIAALDSPAPDLLDHINTACIQADIPWTPVGLQATEGFVGPTVLPRQTACYKCYELRTKGNLKHYKQYLLYEEHLRTTPNRRSYGALPQFKRLMADLAATEAAKVLTHFCPPTTIGRVLNLDFLTQETDYHEVLKLPRCPTCGDPSRQLPMMNPWTT